MKKEERKRVTKRILAILMTVLMVLPGNLDGILAEDNNGTKAGLPSVTAYATKEQLMNSFTPDSNGTAVNIGKLIFGKNSDGAAQEWYVLGKDSGVSGDNTVIFATSPLKTGQCFSYDTSDHTKTYNYEAGTGYGDSAGSIQVYVNHYGASEVRSVHQDMVKSGNNTYFSETEQNLMNVTTVTTYDTKNDCYYTTSDKLYAPSPASTTSSEKI